ARPDRIQERPARRQLGVQLAEDHQAPDGAAQAVRQRRYPPWLLQAKLPQLNTTAERRRVASLSQPSSRSRPQCTPHPSSPESERKTPLVSGVHPEDAGRSAVRCPGSPGADCRSSLLCALCAHSSLLCVSSLHAPSRAREVPPANRSARTRS